MGYDISAIVPAYDWEVIQGHAEVSEAIAAVLRQEGTEILAGAQVTKVEKTAKGKRLHVKLGDEKQQVVVSDILVATGRRPHTAGLGLNNAGVEVDRQGAVVVDETLRTSNPRVWASGDVTPAPQFVYVAAHQGSVSGENAVNGNPREADLSVVPRITFTTPQIAAVGLTEEQAREQGYEVRW